MNMVRSMLHYQDSKYMFWADALEQVFTFLIGAQLNHWKESSLMKHGMEESQMLHILEFLVV